MKLLLLPLLVFLCVLVPAGADAAVGGSVIDRLWEQSVSTTERRVQERTPTTVQFFQQAEQFFLNGTRDVTNMVAVREVYTAMRVGGLLLLGLCTVISLSQLTEAGLMGESANITEWIKRFGVAAFMTMGSIHFYGLWIRVFNVMLDMLRNYLDTHWTGHNDPTQIYTEMVGLMGNGNTLFVLLFAAVLLLVLLALWFLIGGIRVAELAIAVIIAPLVWPVYLIPSLEDIPKTAFRSFLGLNATLLIIVAMLRLAVRMDMGGGIATTVWNFVPSIAMLVMGVFLPTLVRRIVGQGNTGAGLLVTAAYALAGLKGLSLMAAGGPKGPAASPPPESKVPPSPSGPSNYPLAPVPPSGGRSSSTPSTGTARAGAARQILAGSAAAEYAALEMPYEPVAGEPLTISLEQSDPGSGRFDTIAAVEAWVNGRRRVVGGPKPERND